MSDLSYPIGPFQPRTELSSEERRTMIGQIAGTPARLREAVAGLSEPQLDTPYRDGGWTVRQVVHHVPDSHVNAYIRLKLALTEEEPVIRPYDQDAWVKLADYARTPVETSLALLESLHARWVVLFEAISERDFQRPLRHPEHEGRLTVDWLLAMYAWHGRHHTAHITSLRERMGW